MEYELQGSLERSIVGVARRTAVFAAVLMATCVGIDLCSTAVAQAEGTVLCAGYSACSADGFTDHGYQAAESISWWRMYPGDNCTNYVAYVESQTFGVPTPDYLLGNADQWAANAAAQGVQVDTTPTVGSVAYWAGGPEIGGDGHVAIVEDVGPQGSYIDVSESGMGQSDDGFDWVRLYPDAESYLPYPDKFIHFAGTQIPLPVIPHQAPASIPGAEIDGVPVVAVVAVAASVPSSTAHLSGHQPPAFVWVGSSPS
jgi:surface antigen